MVTQADLRWLSQTVASLHEARTSATLLSAAMDAFAEKWHLQAQSCEQVAWDGAHYQAHCLRAEVIPQDYLPCIHDHPVFKVLHTRTAPPLMHIRELAPTQEWHRTDHYNGIARQVGFEDHVILTLKGGADFTAFSLYRDRHFSDVERTLLQVVQEHFQTAWGRTRPQTVPPMRATPMRVMLNSRFRPEALASDQADLLAAYFPAVSGSALPPEVERWLMGLHLPQVPPLTPGASRILQRHGVRGSLYLTFFPQTATTSAWLALSEHLSTEHVTGALTHRERTVLEWLLLGKTDADIGLLLGISRATTSKHVENVLRKMNASSRTKLVASVARPSRGQ